MLVYADVEADAEICASKVTQVADKHVCSMRRLAVPPLLDGLSVTHIECHYSVTCMYVC
jgi:hypothetical protein